MSSDLTAGFPLSGQLPAGFRAGIGYDIHRLVKGRPLVLGGIEIPFEKGLLGHSDADVLVHAACDAVLGAAGLGDLGEHFPDTDPKYAGIYSLELLAETVAMIKEKGWTVNNLDATVFAQQPKLGAYKLPMAEKLATVLETGIDAVNIKATTTENLGLVGTGEAMAAMCIVLIRSESPVKFAPDGPHGA